jgi:hypothetical protein
LKATLFLNLVQWAGDTLPYPSMSYIIINPIETNKKNNITYCLSYWYNWVVLLVCLIIACLRQPIIVVLHITNQNMHKINTPICTRPTHKNLYSFKTNPTPNVIPTVSRSSALISLIDLHYSISTYRPQYRDQVLLKWEDLQIVFHTD